MHHHMNGTVGLLKAITDDFIVLSINRLQSKINRLKCVGEIIGNKQGYIKDLIKADIAKDGDAE